MISRVSAVNDLRHIKYYNTSATRRGAILLKWYSMPLLVLSPVARHAGGARIFYILSNIFHTCLFGEKSENFERYTKISTSFFIQEISRSGRVCCFVVPLEYGRCIVRNLVNIYFLFTLLRYGISKSS